MSDHLRTYGARPYGFKAAPKPANFDDLTAAAAARAAAIAAHDDAAAAAAVDAFTAAHGRYRDQTNRAGVHPGTLLGVLSENGDVA
jgi:hypothetical protein